MLGKTPEEAKGLWCPQTRVVQTVLPVGGGTQLMAGGEVAFNRMASGSDVMVPPASCCIGPLCMFWTWDSELKKTGCCGLVRSAR